MCYDFCFSLYCNCILEGNCLYHIISMLNHTINFLVLVFLAVNCFAD